MIRLKWELLIGILTMLIGVVAIGYLFQWYMREFESDYSQNVSAVTQKQTQTSQKNLPKPTEVLASTNETPQTEATAVDETKGAAPPETGSTTSLPTELIPGDQQIKTATSSMITKAGVPLSNNNTTAPTSTENSNEPQPVNIDADTAIATIRNAMRENEDPNLNSSAPEQQTLNGTSSVTANELDSGNKSSASLRRSDDPDLGEWSEESFIGKMNKNQADADLTSSMSIQSIIAEAVKSHNKPVGPNDAYLSTIAEESSSLSLTTAFEDGDLHLIRNTKPPSQLTTLADEFIVIKQGESLSAIANQLYDDPNAYAKIYELNKDVLDDPNFIVTGQKLRLPAK